MKNDNPFLIIKERQQSAPVDVDALARDLGIKVYYTSLELGVYGKLTLDDERGGASGYAIYVNRGDATVRQRFTVAHEIAHFVLHRDLIDGGEIVDREMYRSNLGSAYETQANRLAAEILMPAALVRVEYKKNPTVVDMARKFHVSAEAMEIRLQSLRLSPNQQSARSEILTRLH